MTSRRVPLGRRMLLVDRRRFASAAAGVGLALALVLLLDGLSAGIDERVSIYERRAGAALFVAQAGTTSLLGATSVVPRSAVDVARATPGVDWATPVRGFFTVPEVAGTKVPSYVVGWQPGSAGGPWDLHDGRAPVGDDEVTVGRALAARTGLSVGDTLDVIGRPFTVVGIAEDADMFMASFVFMTHAATDTLVHSPETTSFVLIGTDDVAGVRTALDEAGMHALTADELIAGDLALKGQTYGTALSLMVALATGVGVLVIALTVYAAVTDRRREYGIVKALGSSNRLLYRLAGTQSLWLAAAGFGAGLVLFAVSRVALGVMRPEFAVAVGPAAVARALGLAVVMGLLATLVPARRLGATEPALAFAGS